MSDTNDKMKAGMMTTALGNAKMNGVKTKSIAAKGAFALKLGVGATAGWFTRKWFKNLTGLGLTAEEKAARDAKKANKA